MSPVNKALTDYENYIVRFADLHFTMNQLDADETFQLIVNKIMGNNMLVQEAFKKYPEFIFAYTGHIDNEGNFTGNKTFINAPSPMSSFLTSLIMGRYH